MSTVPENAWIVGDDDYQVVHHDDSLKGCKEWAARIHGLKRNPVAHRLTDGVYEINAAGTTYWVMDGATTARDNGYPIPEPVTPAALGIDARTCTLAHLNDRPALVWARDSTTVCSEPAPPGLTGLDLEAWARRMAGRLARYGITYTARELTP